ncbi:MAG: hypothetical protein HKO99_13355 [Xanthomonadales bacterium]|nr:hypothetical protein [Xanthomonadales bacterium]
MKRSTLKWLLLLPALMLMAGFGGWWWLLHTESGARWVFARAASASGATVSAMRVSGDLGSGVGLDLLKFDDGNIRVDVERAVIALDLNLLSLSASVETLHADTVKIVSLVEATPDTDGEKNFSFPELPLSLSFRDVRISGIEYSGFSAEDPLLIESVAAAAQLDKSLSVEMLSVALPGLTAQLAGEIKLHPPHALSVEFDTAGHVNASGSLEGDLDSARVAIKTTGPDVQISGTVGQLLNTPEWDLQIRSPRIEIPSENGPPSAWLTAIQAESKGVWPRFELHSEAMLEAVGLEPFRLALTGDGTDRSFSIQQLVAEGPQFAADATGSLAWKDALDVRLKGGLNRLDVHQWLTGWPEDHPVQGSFAIDWAGEDLAIRHVELFVAGTEAKMDGRGTVGLKSAVVDLALNWSDLSWPPASAAPGVFSRNGAVQVTGLPDDWQIDGSLDLQSGKFPPGQLRVSGQGNMTSLELTVHQGEVLGGTIAGKLAWSWAGRQPFAAEILAETIEVTSLVPDYPGVLSATLKAKGEIEPLRADIEIQNLDGNLRQIPVAARGSIQIDQSRLHAKELMINAGASSLKLDGSLYEPGGIDFSADIDSLQPFFSDLNGSLKAAGNISLNPSAPRVSGSVSGSSLEIGPLSIGEVETRQITGPGSGSEIILRQLMVGQRSIESLQIGFGEGPPLTRMSFNARIEGIDVRADLNGALNDWRDPLGSGWSGELAGVGIDYQGQFMLTQEQPAAIAGSPSRFDLDPVCLSGTRDARLCAESTWTAPDKLEIAADLAALPAGLIELLVDTELRFTQMLNGKVNWSQTTANGQTGAARLEISPGAIHLVDDDVMLVETGPGVFGFALSDSKLSEGTFQLAIPGSGDINFSFNVPDLEQGAYSPIQGQARINLRDLSKFGRAIPLFDTISGTLEADLKLSGIVSDPAYTGRAALMDVHLENAASGFSFTEINLSGEVSDADRAVLTGTYRAGEGSGDISATLFFDDLLSPVLELAVQGEALTIVDVPDLEVVANPDLRLSWNRNTLNIDGKLLIPKARLSPSMLPQNAVRQSSDVVIIAGELPEPEPDFLADNAVKIRGNLTVELGEECEIELDFADVSVFGKTEFNWSDGIIPVADGNFDMRGEVQAYGQLLRITAGRIGFPGIPADNPFLNIRAEREIYGNSQIRRAGMFVTGTLKRPQLEPFTVPMTNKERARTLLVTGSDFNYEQGVGAVAVGTYILPRLYVSYGIGVFEEGNVFSVRYDLGKGFGIKATSGERATGLDLNYTLER